MINLPLVRPKGHHTDRIWNITRKLVWDIAERWGLTKIATYHVMAEVASHFDSAEEFAALASTLQPERLAEVAEGMQEVDNVTEG